MSLKRIRTRSDDARSLVTDGIDPGEHKKIARAAGIDAAANSFEAVALEWLVKQKPTWAESHWTKIEAMLKRDLLPQLGSRPITAIIPAELLAALRRIEARGASDTIKRAGIVAGEVSGFAVATGPAERDITPEFRGAIAPSVKKHLAAIIKPKEVGKRLLVIENYVGTTVVRAALRVAPLTLVRPGELRGARWSEFDFGAAEWRISADRMKMQQPHIVPLAGRAVAILRDPQPLTGKFEFVFPSHRSPRRPIFEKCHLGGIACPGAPERGHDRAWKLRDGADNAR